MLSIFSNLYLCSFVCLSLVEVVLQKCGDTLLCTAYILAHYSQHTECYTISLEGKKMNDKQQQTKLISLLSLSFKMFVS